MRHWILAAALGIILAPAPVRAQESVESESAEKAEARRIVDALVEARSALKRGQFRAVGTVETVYSEQGISDVLPSEIEGIFDNERGLLRYETHGQWRSTISSSRNLTPEVVEQLKAGTYQGNPKVREYLAMFARTPDYMVEWYGIGRHEDDDHATCLVEIEDADKNPTYRYLLPFDPSAAGLFNPMEFIVRRDARAILTQLLDDSSNVTVEQSETGEVEIAFFQFQGTLRRTITIAPANGYIAKHMEIRVLDPDGSLKDLPRLETTAGWEVRNGVWIPTHIHVAKYGNTSKEVYDYALDWESVNPERFDEELFTYDSFEGVWDNIEVLDCRHGQVEHIATFGAPFEKIPTAGSPANQARNAPDPRSPFKFWVVIINALLLAALGVWLIVRGMRPKPQI